MRIKRAIIVAVSMALMSLTGPGVMAHEEDHSKDHPHDAPHGEGHTEDRSHVSPHGGQLVTVGSYHYEMLVKPQEIKLYVLDNKLKTLPLKGMEGTFLVQLPDMTKKNVTLEPAEDYFKAAVDTSTAKSFIAIATVKIDGKPNVGRFSYPAK